jgi:hypothetical protein
MPTSAEDIITWYRQRVQQKGYMFSRMRTLRESYEGYVTPVLPDLDFNEQAGTANSVFLAIEQMGMRIASVQPQIICPSLKPGQAKSDSYARIRREAIMAWWDANGWDRKQRRRARHLISYGTAPVIVRPDAKKEIPRWHLLDPFGTYPGTSPDPDSICPPDCIMAYQRTYSWLMARYPAQMSAINRATDPNPDETFEVLEYVDDDEHVMICVGNSQDSYMPASPFGPSQVARSPGMTFAELSRFPNVIGRCPVVIPSRIGLDHPQGQFDGMPPLAMQQAKTMALMQIANERAIFPDVYFVARQNEQVSVLRDADGRAGEPGEVQGGDMKTVDIVPPPLSMQFLQLLRDELQTGVSSDFYGQAPTNVRTGRAGEQLNSETVNFWLQEAQETLGFSYQHENALAFDLARQCFGHQKKSFLFTAKGIKGPVDYIPMVHFETNVNKVAWPNPGSDANNLIIGLAQRVGSGMMSKKTARGLDPYVDDPEIEERRVEDEQLGTALLQSLSQSVASGQIGPVELAQIKADVATGTPLEAAITAAHKSAQKSQAANVTAPPAPGDPSAQPGMSAPGMQAPPGGPPGAGGPGGQPPGQAIGPVPPSLQNLGALMSAVRPRQNNLPPQQGAVPTGSAP